MKTLQRLLCVFCLWCIPGIAYAQDSSLDPIKQLLMMPAPTPRTVEEPAEEEPRNERPPEFFNAKSPPPDTAPIDDLLAYWGRWVGQNGGPDPTEGVRQRLLEACLSDRELLLRFLPLLPWTETAGRQVKEIYDRSLNDPALDEYWGPKVRQWLVFNTKYFLDELLALANKVRDNEKNSSVDKAEALEALARVDWAAAEPLLQSLASGSQQRSRALALALLYKQAIRSKDGGAEEKYRRMLQAIASDKSALGRARDTVIDTLLLSEWAGRDDWYLSLFPDETLLALHDGSYGFSPLTTLFVNDPEKWIPIMTRLVESRDLNVRSAAASCLITFQNTRARKDALKPLLPWLSNPEWVRDAHGERLRLIQSMENIEMPESVPGLISVVERDSESSYERSYAAESLAKYKDARAVPALKKALAQEKGEDHRTRIIAGLLASGGLTDTEQVDALAAYAERSASPEGREELWRYRSFGDDPLPTELAIGSLLANKKDAPDSLVRAVLARAEFLKKNKPEISRALLDVAHWWQGRLIDLDMIHRIGNGTADADTIAKAIERRTKLRESVEVEMRALFAGRGAAPGIAAVLAEDSAMADSILQSGSRSAQIALLASARLAQMPLAVATIGRLMRSEDPLLARAAERYLLVEDSPEARQLLWTLHTNESFVTGWRENIQLIGGNNFDLLGKMEEKLRAELFTDNPPLETFALVANSENYTHVLRIYSDKAVYTYYEDPARYREHLVTKEQLAVFRTFMTANRIEELGPQIGPCHHNCWISEFLALSKNKGRRVFSHQGVGSWLPVIANFEMLGGKNTRTHYALEKEINGLEVLYADESLALKDVWQDGQGIHILVRREETPDEIAERKKADAADEATEDDDEEAARIRKQTRARVRLGELLSWRLLENGKAGKVTTAPEGYATDETSIEFDSQKFPSHLNEYLSQAAGTDFLVVAANFDGLWKQQAAQKPIRITGEDAYANPIVTRDGKWVVAAKTDSHWGVPNYVVRISLQTSREYRVELPPADNFGAVAYLAIPNKVLLRRAKDYGDPRDKTVGPDQPEYYLLDAATGESQLIKGVFAPLLEERRRFLQPTGRANEYWAAIPDRTKNQTQVGRYNLKDFSFTVVFVAPQILFQSGEMWVDETAGNLYLVYEGQLMRLPLKSAQ